MSKIYEALLRAEIERTAAKNAAEERAPAQDTSVAVATLPAVESRREIPQSVIPQSIIPQSVIPETLVEPDERLSLGNLDGIQAATWSPSWEQLQALEERGGVLEQFRTLRSRIQEFQSLNTLKTILVSSGKPQEGKSFVSVNLAVSLARHKAAKVLLIDGDMRRSSLQTVLGTSSEPGLTDYLSGHATIDQVIQRGQVAPGAKPLPRGLASLFFLPAGSDAENAADLSGNNRFAELIQTVSPYVDWIVIDSSPVNLVTDAVNLARAADAVLLVARGGVTTFQSAQRAMSEFKASKILGLVLNAVQNLPKTEGYYGQEKPDEEAR